MSNPTTVPPAAVTTRYLCLHACTPSDPRQRSEFMTILLVNNVETVSLWIVQLTVYLAAYPLSTVCGHRSIHLPYRQTLSTLQLSMQSECHDYTSQIRSNYRLTSVQSTVSTSTRTYSADRRKASHCSNICCPEARSAVRPALIQRLSEQTVSAGMQYITRNTIRTVAPVARVFELFSTVRLINHNSTASRQITWPLKGPNNMGMIAQQFIRRRPF